MKKDLKKMQVSETRHRMLLLNELSEKTVCYKGNDQGHLILSLLDTLKPERLNLCIYIYT